MAPVLVALLLAAHGLVHASYALPAPAATGTGPPWPFYVDHSWLLTGLGFDAGVTRAVAMLLLAAVVAGYVVAALAILGIVPGTWFAAAAVAASAASALMLMLYFTPWILLGLAIDAVVVVAVLVVGWRPGAAL